MTPEGAKRLRMGIFLGSVALVGVVLWLSSGYGLGHDTYVAPDRSFSFRYPAGYQMTQETFGTAPQETLAVTVKGSATISAFTAIRKCAWARELKPESRDAALQGYLRDFLKPKEMQIGRIAPVQRAYGAGTRVEAIVAFEGEQRSVAYEGILKGEELYLFAIEGGNADILKDPEGVQFFNSVTLQ